jgi:hypothetical protein
LDSDVVPFDWDPLFPDIGSTAAIGRTPVQSTSPYSRFTALCRNEQRPRGFRLRHGPQERAAPGGDNVDQFRQDVIEGRDYRNRLIEIFGSPCDGTIGAGKPYPAGYAGPDLLFMYSCAGSQRQHCPPPSATYPIRMDAFAMT